MQLFVSRPSIDLYPGIIVGKDTTLEFSNDNVKQTVKDLEMHCVQTVKGDGFVSTYDTTIELHEGDILLFEGEGRGYIKPVGGFCSIDEAIDDLQNVKGKGE